MSNRTQRTTLAQETLAILEAGQYQTPSGHRVSIALDLETAVGSSRLYRPEDFLAPLPLPPPLTVPTVMEVTSESALEAAARVWASSRNAPVCLNFASAKNPGGGFLSGSQAQEESLARSSGLYPCLAQMMEMYEHNRHLKTCLYSDYMIYSPRVPVFRNDDGSLLEMPYLVSFLSAPAVNAGAVRSNEPNAVSQIEPTLRTRMANFLWIARQQEAKSLILGAWGCGVFGNDAATIARLFSELLYGPYQDQFPHVVFAIYDRTPSQDVLSAFQAAL